MRRTRSKREKGARRTQLVRAAKGVVHSQSHCRGVWYERSPRVYYDSEVKSRNLPTEKRFARFKLELPLHPTAGLAAPYQYQPRDPCPWMYCCVSIVPSCKPDEHSHLAVAHRIVVRVVLSAAPPSPLTRLRTRVRLHRLSCRKDWRIGLGGRRKRRRQQQPRRSFVSVTLTSSWC